MPVDRRSVEALKEMLSQIELLVSTGEALPKDRTARILELLRAAQALAEDLGR